MQTLTKIVVTEDDAIIRETLEGNPDAFAQLILKYKDQLFDMACRILNNRAEAEDVLQDAFLEAYKHLADFHHKARFSTWVYSILLNRIRNHLRHNKVIRWSSLDAQSNRDDDYKPPEIAERGPAFPMVIEHKFELEKIQKEIRYLPVLYQSILILHYFQNVPLEEVANRLNRPVGTIKVYAHRARKLLYKRLAHTPSGPKKKTSLCLNMEAKIMNTDLCIALQGDPKNSRKETSAEAPSEVPSESPLARIEEVERTAPVQEPLDNQKAH